MFFCFNTNVCAGFVHVVVWFLVVFCCLCRFGGNQHMLKQQTAFCLGFRSLKCLKHRYFVFLSNINILQGSARKKSPFNLVQITLQTTSSKLSSNTVDGRDPAPPGMYKSF